MADQTPSEGQGFDLGPLDPQILVMLPRQFQMMTWDQWPGAIQAKYLAIRNVRAKVEETPTP